jgi:parvulin-like peptidyl-prolyl isomerase
MKTPGLREALRVAPELAVGALSNPVPTQGGQLIFCVEKRLPLDEEAFEKEKANVAESIAEQRADAAFLLWFAERRKAAGLITKIGT